MPMHINISKLLQSLECIREGMLAYMFTYTDTHIHTKGKDAMHRQRQVYCRSMRARVHVRAVGGRTLATP